MTSQSMRPRLVVTAVSPSLPAMLDWLDGEPEIESNTDVMKAWSAAWRACEQHHGLTSTLIEGEGAP